MRIDASRRVEFCTRAADRRHAEEASPAVAACRTRAMMSSQLSASHSSAFAGGGTAGTDGTVVVMVNWLTGSSPTAASTIACFSEQVRRSSAVRTSVCRVRAVGAPSSRR